MKKLFLRIRCEKNDDSKEITVYKNIELAFKKGIGENELPRIKRELEPLVAKSWEIHKTTGTISMITFEEITTIPEKEPKCITYIEIIVEKEYNPTIIKFSRNGKNAYISNFCNDPDTAINIILKLALENT